MIERAAAAGAGRAGLSRASPSRRGGRTCDPTGGVAGTGSRAHSENLGDALARLARYKRPTCPEEVHVERDGDEARVHMIWLSADSPVPSFIVDATFAALHRLARLGTGQAIAPLRLEVTRTPDRGRRLVRHFQCDVRHGAPADVIVFRRTDLALPFFVHARLPRVGRHDAQEVAERPAGVVTLAAGAVSARRRT